MPDTVDNVARSQIASHERECVRREEIVDRRFEEVKDDIREVKRLIEGRALAIWTIGGGALVAGVNGLFQLIKPFVHP